MADGFTRSIAAIDRDLHEQVQRRETGIAEVLHGCFMAERADRAIDRLIEERCEASKVKAEPVRSR